MTSLFINLWILLGISVLCWVLSLPTKDTSWVDRIWSVIPVVYVWVFAAGAGLQDVRLDVMAVLVTLWGARLTFNFARKGGYAPGGEDYRWEVLRAGMKNWQYALFNIFFIVIYQNILLMLITLPAFTALMNPTPFGVGDVICTVLFLGLLTMETVADQQQWNFHKWKNAEVAAGRTPSPRFLQTGLFSISRHPNFFAEQSQWWVIFAFGCVAAGSILQWTVVGAALLTVLFIGSTRFTEQISLSKYPEYRDYQRRVSAVIPWFPRRSESEAPAAN